MEKEEGVFGVIAHQIRTVIIIAKLFLKRNIDAMQSLDPRSFILISTCLAALCGFLCLVLRYSVPRDIKGLNSWGISCATLVLASLLFASRGRLTILYSSFIANIAVVTGITLMYCTIRRFCERRPHIALCVLVPSIVATLLIWPTFIADDYRARIIIVSTVNAAVFLAAAQMLWHHRERRFAEIFTLTVFAGTGMVSIARCIFAILSVTVANPLADWSSVQYVYLATFAFSSVALSLGFILMVLKRHQLRLEDAAMRDGLTGVATRSAFETMAQRELAKSYRAQHVSSLLMIDLDNFKSINDQYGHRGGDMVLKEFVRRTTLVLRNHDLFGRYGGEEFVVLLPDTSNEVALQIATRLCETVRQTSSADIPIFTVSIGVATRMPDSEDIGDFLNQADKALYRAKAAGKNRVECAGNVRLHHLAPVH